MKAESFGHILKFKRPAGTSRGILKVKESWFIVLRQGDRLGIGECGLLRGLSRDDRPGYEAMVEWACRNIDLGPQQLDEALVDWPSIRFGVEMAFRSFSSTDPMILFPSEFTTGKKGIPINGLIWMGDPDFIREQIAARISEGFHCLKMKVGALDFDSEVEILSQIRRNFSAHELEIRLDANGGFDPESALNKLEQLSGFEIHSIEQPITVEQHDKMAELVKSSPIPIALDEELIGVTSDDAQRKLLERIQPHYIILKPSLLGGFAASSQWIDLAGAHGIGWWVTSALESSVGLNAIAQWTFGLNSNLPQGLGTGSLYTNNFASPLGVNGGNLWYGTSPWEVPV